MKGIKKEIEYAEYMSIGFEFVLAIVIGYGAGFYLDKWLGTKPIFTIFLLVCGFAAAVRSLYQMAKKLEISMDEKVEDGVETEDDGRGLYRVVKKLAKYVDKKDSPP